MDQTLIGAYGAWAASLMGEAPRPLSFRHNSWTDLDAWRAAGRARLAERLAAPNLGAAPAVTVERVGEHEGLHVEELTWQLPMGPPTRAYFLKPAGATGRLPGLLALHDHGGLKFFGRRKIADVGQPLHPILERHRRDGYEGAAWANEIARRGYAVLVPDAFPFDSRRVRLADVPEVIRGGVTDPGPAEREDEVTAYNAWASNHEHVMAKSLCCAGTSWPGVWLAEDRIALDLLCARDDVDPERVGCGGLSGGGMRTVFLAGSDDRIRCAVCVGLMTTWRDCLLAKCYTHTWMMFVPGLPQDFDFPEILGLRAPLPTLVQNCTEDGLFTLSEMRRADGILSDVFAKAEAGERYRCSFYPGGHKFDRPMQAEAFEWWDHWLRG